MFVIFQLCLYSVIVNVNFNLQSACLRVSSTTCTLQSSMQNIVDGYRLLLLTLVDVQYPSIRCMSESAIRAAGTAASLSALTTTTATDMSTYRQQTCHWLGIGCTRKELKLLWSTVSFWQKIRICSAWLMELRSPLFNSLMQH